ncbi:MAG: hypothetical protein ACTSVB_04480 [Candidatus Heimdallarchaeaceae archaeon]
MTKENDKALRVYRKLIYFFENKIPVHFKLENGDFRNGLILDLNFEKLTLILKENVMGELPILLEDIDENSIFKFEDAFPEDNKKKHRAVYKKGRELK